MSISVDITLLEHVAPYALIVIGLLVVTALLWPTAGRGRRGIPTQRQHARRMRSMPPRSTSEASRRLPQPALR